MTAFSWDFVSFVVFRFLAGAGIGGEYSAIDEMIPARLRGQMALFVGYMFAAGLMIGAALVELAIGVKAERKSLESVAAPLTAVRQETGAGA